MQRASLEAIRAKDAEDSLRIIKAVFNNEQGPAKDIVCLNAGAAIYAAGLSNTLAEGIEKAQQVIAEGKAGEKLQQLVDKTNSY